MLNTKLKINYSYLFILSSLIFIVFSRTITADFLILDDDINTYLNPNLKELNIDSIVGIWTKPYEHLFIPVTYSFWAIISAVSKEFFGGFDPLPFHAANILMHISNTLLLFIIANHFFNKIYGRDKRVITATILVCLFFGLHPIQVEAVSWISGMKDLLSTFFLLISIIIYFTQNDPTLNFTPKEKNAGKSIETIKHISAFVFFLLAVLSKPNTIILPFVLITTETIIWRKSFKKTFIKLLPWFLISCIFSFAAKKFMPSSNESENAISFIHRILIASDSYFFYVKKLLWPDTLIFDYGRTPDKVISDGLSYYIPCIFLILAIILWGLNNRRIITGLLIIFVIILSPYSGIIPFEFQRISTVADRYCYLDTAIFSILLLTLLLETRRLWTFFYSICVIALIVMLIKTYHQTLYWQDNISLNQYTISKTPLSYTANMNLGIALSSKGFFEQSIVYYKKALEISPNNELSYFNLGIAYACLNQKLLATEQIKKLLAIHPQSAQKLELSTKQIYLKLENIQSK